MALLSTAEVAERLGVTVGRVQHLIWAGRLPAQKIGRDYVIQEEDLKLVADRPTGRPSKAALDGKRKDEMKQADRTAQKLNQAFRKATEDGQQASKMKANKK
ncbi:MAG: helix-turn-helix domain-containing protein [Pyrinomonadaceae bacterium]|jgi:excisionase family DNA binding protein|nr:helix-turn-helix domain-containing protein [Pyrinomonadaceae bacterium]